MALNLDIFKKLLFNFMHNPSHATSNNQHFRSLFRRVVLLVGLNHFLWFHVLSQIGDDSIYMLHLRLISPLTDKLMKHIDDGWVVSAVVIMSQLLSLLFIPLFLNQSLHNDRLIRQQHNIQELYVCFCQSNQSFDSLLKLGKHRLNGLWQNFQ